MSTESCGRCGATTPAALLRNVSLHVDGSEVDAQTICPDCFSDWIAHYQSQMAGDMPGADSGPETATEQTGSDDAALDEAVRAAQQHVDTAESASPGRATPDPNRGESVEQVGGDEIREVGTGSAADGGVDVDLGGTADEEEDDDGGLLPG